MQLDIYKNSCLANNNDLKAVNGHEALRLVNENKCDFIIVDNKNNSKNLSLFFIIDNMAFVIVTTRPANKLKVNCLFHVGNDFHFY